MSGDLSALVSRLESVTSRLEGLAVGGCVASSPGGGDAGATSALVEKFDKQVQEGKLEQYIKLSSKLGGDIEKQSKAVTEAFKAERKVLVLASKYKRPKDISPHIKPLTDAVEAVVNFGESRTSKVFNSLKTVSEGIACLGWVAVEPKPAPYIKQTKDQALFYGNRVIKEFKNKEQDHVAWVNAYVGMIEELYNYVKADHTTGLIWNKNGPEVPATPGPSAGPPPPPPPAIQAPDDAPANKDEAGRNNLLSALSKGANVTQGLRKVTDDMKTHKNPELRSSSVVKAGSTKQAASTSTPKYGSGATSAKKPPVLALQGKKWVVEYQENQPNLSLANVNPKQTIYVFKCTKSTLKVEGKVNSIIIDSCKRMALCFTDVISSVEIINSQGAQIQVLGKCPTVSIDKTDGCQVYLSNDSLKCEIISAKSSEMNISIPPKSGSGDFTEHAIPEQFKTIWNGSALVTDCTDITS